MTPGRSWTVLASPSSSATAAAIARWSRSTYRSTLSSRARSEISSLCCWISRRTPERAVTTAHELGHNLDAQHERADRICVDRGRAGRCRDHRHTITWEMVNKDNLFRFSRGTIDATHNNASAIRQHLYLDRAGDL